MDDFEDDDDEAEACPICGTEDCSDHLLACFDVTFADQGEGEFRTGLVGGALYAVAEIGEVFNRARLAWIDSVRRQGSAVAPSWINDVPGLRAYFDDLGNADDFEIDDAEDPDEASDRLAGATDSHAFRAREVLESTLTKCGWAEITTEKEVDVPLFSTTYLSWWDEAPEAMAEAVREFLKVALAKADAQSRQG